MVESTVDISSLKEKAEEITTNTPTPQDSRDIAKLQNSVNDHEEQLGKYRNELERVNNFMIGVVIALFLVLVGIAVTVFLDSKNEYYLYREQVKQLQSEKYDYLDMRLKQLESNSTESVERVSPTSGNATDTNNDKR